MKELSRLSLVAAKTRLRVIKNVYPQDKYLDKITDRIIEDIDLAIENNEIEEVVVSG